VADARARFDASLIIGDEPPAAPPLILGVVR
jgi:hypothetical protein